MRICECGNKILDEIKIDGKRKNLRNRKRCLVCCPYGSSPYSVRYTVEQRRTKKLENGRKKTKKHYDKTKKLTGIGSTNFRRKLRKLILVMSLGGRCLSCGYGKILRNLVFHHLDERKKKIDLSERSFQFSWEKIYREAQKCVLLCHNCHGEIHSKKLENESLAISLMEEKLISINPSQLALAEKMWNNIKFIASIDLNDLPSIIKLVGPLGFEPRTARL